MPAIDLDARFDARALRDALGRFATGIAVVMARDADGPIGVTVNSFSSVSLEPPLILFSMARKLHALPRLESASAYSVNILRESQQDISNRFARHAPDQFASLRLDEGITGAPCLSPVHARFECVPYAHYDGGDHVIFIGRVVHLHAEDEGSPLLFYGGRYRRLADTPAGG